MSKETRHIDDLFRSGLSGHQALPPPQIWNKVSGQITASKRRGIIKSTVRIAAGIAILLGFGGSLLYYFLQDNSGDNYLTPERVTIPLSGKESAPDHSPFTIPLTEPLSGLHAVETGLSGKIAGRIESGTGKISPAVMTAPEGSLAKRKTGPDGNDYNIFRSNINPLAAGRVESLSKSLHPELFIKMPVTAISEREQRFTAYSNGSRGNRWQAGIMTAPNYSYRTLSRGPDKSLNKAAFNSTENGLVSFSAKIAVNYFLNERLSLQSGFEIINMGQSTGVILFDLSALNRLRSAYLQSGLPQEIPSFQNSLGTLHTTEKNVMLVARESIDLNYGGFQPYLRPVTENYNNFNDRGRVIQELYYIQTPVIMRFNLVNGNTSLLINAGLGLNFLAGNRVIFEQDGNLFNIGKTLGIRNFSFSGIAGAALERNIGNNTSLVIEPRFTHFISSVNRTTVHRHLPYSISVFGGIYRRF